MSDPSAFLPPGAPSPATEQGRPSPPQSEPGYLRLHLQGSRIWTSLVVPNVLINGYLVPSTYGETVYPVPPGQHVVSAQTQWMRTYGQAQVTFSVAPGHVVNVWYATPWSQFSSGSMGFEKQKRRGATLYAAILVLVLLAVLVPFAMTVFGSS